MNKNKKQTKTSPAFTIVELLIVIVIIGILAAITIVSYTGITKKANESTVQAELSNAKKQISLYYAEHGVYPKTLGLNNCLSNNTVNPDPDTKYCLKSSGGSTFTLTDATGSDYTLTLTKGTDVAYKVTKDTGPTSTTAVVVAGSFVKAWGGVNGDYGLGLVQTGDGGYAITGYSSSFGAGGTDVFLAKYDANGSLTWNKLWGASGDDRGFSLALSSDGGYIVTGYTNNYGAGSSEMLLIKFDASGNLIWNKTWGGANVDYGYDVIQSSDGGYAVVGYTTSYGTGNSDVFLIKYDINGNLIWNRLWGGASYDNGFSLAQSVDNGYIISGNTSSFGAGPYDLFLAKFDSSGSLSWSKTWGGTGDESGSDVIKTNDGGYIATGYVNSFGAGSYDSFLAKFDSSGSLSWSKTWGGTGDDRGNNIVQTSDNGYLLTGITNSFGAGGYDIPIVKYDVNGNLSWNKILGGVGSDSGGVLIQAIDGGYAVVGGTNSYGAGNYDSVLVKYGSSGSINNCISPMCQSPAATITAPSATTTSPSASVSIPSATVTSPTATITTPTATVTTVVAP